MEIAIYILFIIIGFIAGIGFSIFAFLFFNKNQSQVNKVVGYLENISTEKAYFSGLSDEEQDFKEGVLDNKKDIKIE